MGLKGAKEKKQKMTKETIIDALVKSGMTQEDAEKAFTSAIPAAATDADLLRKIEMLEASVEAKNKLLRQAIDVAQRANDAQKARDEAEKQKLIESIITDSHFVKDDLQDKALSELQTIRYTIDKALNKTFASVTAELDAETRKQPLLTAGYYDSATKSWKGGI